MQDRFKFRTYIPDLKFFKYWGWIEDNHYIGLCACGYYRMPELLEKYTNQCTGLRDRHNNLIYEGDIVRFYSLYGHATFEIKWSEKFATFGYEDDETDFSELGRLYDEAAYVEVIGNIYDNPELLGVENVKSDIIAQEEKKKIKRSECPYGGIDCAWCDEDCE